MKTHTLKLLFPVVFAVATTASNAVNITNYPLTTSFSSNEWFLLTSAGNRTNYNLPGNYVAKASDLNALSNNIVSALSSNASGSAGPLVIGVSPARIRGDESVTLKVSGSGFSSDGMWIALDGASEGGTWISASEIDVPIVGGILADGVYDVSYHASNGAFTLFGGLRVGPDAVNYATNAGSAGAIPALTVTNSTSTTWGRGAGLICADTNYIYVSWGTNKWKRAALGTW